MVDRWYTRYPSRVLRRLEAVIRGDVRLPSVSLVENFRAKSVRRSTSTRYVG